MRDLARSDAGGADPQCEPNPILETTQNAVLEAADLVAQPTWLELIIPVFCVVCVIAILEPQISHRYAVSTISYGALLGLPLVLIGVPLAIQAVRRKLSCRPVFNFKPCFTHEKMDLGLFSLLTVALITSFEMIGYVAGFGLFIIAAGRRLYTKSWWPLILVSIGIVALIHFVFVIEFELSLPSGWLWGGR